MRIRIIPVVLAAMLAAFAMVGALSTRTAAQNPMGDADAEPAPFNPQMAAMMSMLIQPRHARLGLAGKEENGNWRATCSISSSKASWSPRARSRAGKVCRCPTCSMPR